MRIQVGHQPERSANLPGRTWGAMHLGAGDDANDIHSFAWRGYCITCGAVSSNDQPMTWAWAPPRARAPEGWGVIGDLSGLERAVLKAAADGHVLEEPDSAAAVGVAYRYLEQYGPLDADW